MRADETSNIACTVYLSLPSLSWFLQHRFDHSKTAIEEKLIECQIQSLRFDGGLSENQFNQIAVEEVEEKRSERTDDELPFVVQVRDVDPENSNLIGSGWNRDWFRNTVAVLVEMRSRCQTWRIGTHFQLTIKGGNMLRRLFYRILLNYEMFSGKFSNQSLTG